MSLIAYRIWKSVSPEAKPLLELIKNELLASAPTSGPANYRRARLLSLLCADALNGARVDASRAMRWTRFVRALETHLEHVRSIGLEQILDENRDLLERLHAPEYVTAA